MALINAFDHLADIAALLLEMLQLLAKHSHFGVQLVSLGLQPAFFQEPQNIECQTNKTGDLESAHILAFVRHSQEQLLDLGVVQIQIKVAQTNIRFRNFTIKNEPW